VIEVDEEYAVLAKLGIRRSQQAFVEEDGKSYDILDGHDRKTDEPVRLYFDISRPVAHLMRQLQPKK
jgi:hypothetical protein